MRAAIFEGPGDIRVGERPDPIVKEPTDAMVRVMLGCVCGSDLWYYRGESPHAVGSIGHEFIGLVEDLGAEVTGLAAGDLVVAPFVFRDMSCPHCKVGATFACLHGGSFGNGEIDGGQGEAVRVPLAGSSLVKVPGSPGDHSDERLRSLLALSDVMCTGHHAAVCGRVKKGDTVAVVGDGAVVLSAVLASKRIGAERIVALSGNPVRQQLAREFGAIHILSERGDDAVAAVMELTDGIGVDAALECVGTGQSAATAMAIARPGSTVGIIGAPTVSISPSRRTSGGESAGMEALPPPGPISPSFCPTFSRAGSTRAVCSTTRPTSTTSLRPTPPWTSAGPSSH
jgi:threonine dehydrogenase-like Zn-dependent dehydrogenase